MVETGRFSSSRAGREGVPGPSLTRMSTTGTMGRAGRPLALFWWAVAAGATLTLAVVALPFVRFAYRAPALHVSLETANALIALVVAYLVYGRFRKTRRLQELLLVL